MENRIPSGDCRNKRLRELPDACVGLVLTDPPDNTGVQTDTNRLRHFFPEALPADRS